MVTILDEAKSLLGRDHELYVVKELISMNREFGIGLIAADQTPSLLSQNFLSNAGTTIMLRLSDGTDLHAVSAAIGATYEQMKANYSLRPGEALVRTFRARDLHRITIPFLDVGDKHVADEELSRLMAPMLHDWHRPVIPIETAKPPHAQQRAAQEPQAALQQPATATPPADGLDAEASRFLRVLADNPARPSSEQYRACGLSNSQGHRLKTRLLTRGAISQVRTNLGKGGKICLYLVPSPLILESLGIELRSEGRGGVLHQYFQQELKQRCEALGYSATIEENVAGTGEAPDVGLEKDGQRTAVEVCITTKPPANVAAIEKCLRLGYGVVVVAFIHSGLLRKTRERAQRTLPNDALARVAFCRLDQVTDVLLRRGEQP